MKPIEFDGDDGVKLVGGYVARGVMLDEAHKLLEEWLTWYDQLQGVMFFPHPPRQVTDDLLATVKKDAL